MKYKLISLSFCCLLFTIDASADQKFILKSDDPRTGSNIKSNIVFSDIPLKKSYDQLTNQEKDKIRAAYDNFSLWDEPPYPKNGLHNILKSLQKAAEIVDAEGRLIVVAHVDMKGEVTLVQIYEIPDKEMIPVIAAALYKEKFKPALCNGEPCEMDFPLQMNFVRQY